MPKPTGDVEIRTKEILLHGLRENIYLVTLKADKFSIDAKPEEASVTVELNQLRASELLEELWSAMPSEKFDAIVDRLKKENGF